MKKVVFNKMMFCLCSALLFTTTLRAEEEVPKEEERAPSEVVTRIEENLFRELKAQEDEENTQNQEQIPEEEKPVGFFANDDEDNKQGEEVITNGAYYYTSHPDAYHHAINVSADGSTLEMEDGSIWDIKWSDRNKALDWRSQHAIVLTPNHSWFSSYNFKFINLDTNEAVRANMILTPVLNNIKTHWIELIDYSARQILLEDGSIWQMSWFDQSVVNKFVQYDVVIIGTNDGWWRGSNPNILMVVKSQQYARGKRIN